MNRLVKYELGAGAGVAAGADSGLLVLGDAFPATTSTALRGLCADRSGNIYLADPEQEAIYKITESGALYLFAGDPGMQGFVNGKGTDARFNQPVGICSDKSANIYVADQSNGRIRKITDSGQVSTLAGGFTTPTDVAVCPNGDVIVCDQGTNKIHRVEPGGRSFVIAGSAAGTSGDVAGEVGGAKVKGNDARFLNPSSVTVNQYGDVYVADTGNFKIKKITPDGWVVRMTGTTQGNTNGVANTAQLAGPLYIECHQTAHNYIYIVDDVTAKDRIKKMDQNGTVSTVAYPDSDLVRGITVSPANKLFVLLSDTYTHADQSSSSTSSSSQESESSSSSSGVSSQSTSSRSSSSSPSSASTSSRTESSQSVSESSPSSSSSSWSTAAAFVSSSSSSSSESSRTESSRTESSESSSGSSRTESSQSESESSRTDSSSSRTESSQSTSSRTESSSSQSTSSQP